MKYIILIAALTLATVHCGSRQLVDKNLCADCFDDHHDCYLNFNDKGPESFECARSFCKDAADCGYPYKCRERSSPCPAMSKTCQETDCVLDDSFVMTKEMKNPCEPNPCGSYQACVTYPKFCSSTPCPHHACFGVL